MGDRLIGQISINTHSLIRTDRALEVPWESEWENVMELQVWLELMFKGCQFDRLTEPTYLHRRHGDNMSDKTSTEPEGC